MTKKQNTINELSKIKKHISDDMDLIADINTYDYLELDKDELKVLMRMRTRMCHNYIILNDMILKQLNK